MSIMTALPIQNSFPCNTIKHIVWPFYFTGKKTEVQTGSTTGQQGLLLASQPLILPRAMMLSGRRGAGLLDFPRGSQVDGSALES